MEVFEQIITFSTLVAIMVGVASKVPNFFPSIAYGLSFNASLFLAFILSSNKAIDKVKNVVPNLSVEQENKLTSLYIFPDTPYILIIILILSCVVIALYTDITKEIKKIEAAQKNK